MARKGQNVLRSQPFVHFDHFVIMFGNVTRLVDRIGFPESRTVGVEAMKAFVIVIVQKQKTGFTRMNFTIRSCETDIVNVPNDAFYPFFGSHVRFMTHLNS